MPVEETIADLCVQIRPLIARDTPLDEVPRAWRQHVEPKIVRWRSDGDCWFWIGAVDCELRPKKAKSLGHGRWGTEYVSRYVMSIFFDLSRVRRPQVVPMCGHRNCVNPHHLLVAGTSHQQRDRERTFADCSTSSTRQLTAQNWIKERGVV